MRIKLEIKNLIHPVLFVREFEDSKLGTTQRVFNGWWHGWYFAYNGSVWRNPNGNRFRAFETWEYFWVAGGGFGYGVVFAVRYLTSDF